MSFYQIWVLPYFSEIFIDLVFVSVGQAVINCLWINQPWPYPNFLQSGYEIFVIKIEWWNLCNYLVRFFFIPWGLLSNMNALQEWLIHLIVLWVATAFMYTLYWLLAPPDLCTVTQESSYIMLHQAEHAAQCWGWIGWVLSRTAGNGRMPG